MRLGSIVLAALIITTLLAVVSLSAKQPQRFPAKSSKLSCLKYCLASTENRGLCGQKCKNPAEFAQEELETFSDGPFIEMMKEWFGSLRKKRTDRKNKKTTDKKKPAVVPPKEDDEEVVVPTPVEEPTPEPVKPQRTITEEQIWEYFEKSYYSALFGACNGDKCRLSLPEVMNMSSPQFKYDSYLNEISTKLDQLESFSKSYQKFLFALDVPEDLEATVEKDEVVVQLQAEIKTQEESVAQEEENCKAKYTGTFARMFPDFDVYKQRFCATIGIRTDSLFALAGKLQAVKQGLMNGWETALAARKQYLAVPEEYRHTWTKQRSLDHIVQAAKNAEKSSLSIKFDGNSIHGVQKEHAKVGEDIYPDIIRVPKDHMGGPELSFDNANKNISNSEFNVEIGSFYFAQVSVQPNATWFSKAAVSSYKAREEYKADAQVTKDYFFNEKDGSLVGYPESINVLVQPYVKMTVSKLTEKYVRQFKRIAVFSFVFDVNAGDEIISETCPSGNTDCVFMTFKKSAKQFDPLLFSVKNN